MIPIAIVPGENWIDADGVVSHAHTDPFLRYHIWCGYLLHAARSSASAEPISALMRAVASADFGDPIMALVLAARVLRQQPASLAATGVVNRVLAPMLPGDRSALFDAALEIDPASELINAQIGQRHLNAGKPRIAVPYLRQAFQHRGFTGRYGWPYLVALASSAEYAELLSLTDAIIAQEGSERTPRGDGAYRQLALAKMSLGFDRPALVAQIQALEASPAWLDTTGVMAALQAAVRDCRPFSYIRMGDGEARFLCYMEPAFETSLTWLERSAMVNSVWINWFVEPIETFAPELSRLHANLADTLESADIIGLLSSDSMIHDHYHFGFLAHMQQHILSGMAGRDVHYAAALGHHEIHHRDRWFSFLLRGLPFIGFVGCHPELAGKLAAAFDIPLHASYVVPGENGRPLPEERKGLGHFPDVFDRLLTELHVPFTGAVFLVGAGLLGKIYCGRIKALGGIAIDIGSLADAWMGFNTRPGSFDQIENFVLAA